MGLTRKTSQFFWEPAPHHDGPSFDSLPTSNAIPPAPVAASHYWDSMCVVVQSDLPDKRRAATVSGGNCYISNFAGTPAEPSFVRPLAVVRTLSPGHRQSPHTIWMQHSYSVRSDLFGNVGMGTFSGRGRFYHGWISSWAPTQTPLGSSGYPSSPKHPSTPVASSDHCCLVWCHCHLNHARVDRAQQGRVPPLKTSYPLLPILLQLSHSLLPICNFLPDKEVVLCEMRPSSHRKKNLSCGIRRREGLLALSCLGNRHQSRRSLPLPDFVGAKLRPQGVAIVPNHVQLHYSKVVLRLNVLKHVRQRGGSARPSRPLGRKDIFW